jgi:Protein of unknown function (DUF2794)
MSDGEPIPFRLRSSQRGSTVVPAQQAMQVAFNRQELSAILDVYGRHVATGEWRDYAMDFGREAATFSVYRRTSEVPIYRIEKCPKLARKQGAFSVISATGAILKRGPELKRVLAMFDKRIHLVS